VKRLIFVTLDFDFGTLADPDVEGTVEFIAGALTLSLEGMAHGFNRQQLDLGNGARLAVDVSLDHDDGVEARTIELLADEKGRPWEHLPRELRLKEARRAAGAPDPEERIDITPQGAAALAACSPSSRDADASAAAAAEPEVRS
jgi:hypothetical protein